jgi:putative MATE family efflux protein
VVNVFRKNNAGTAKKNSEQILSGNLTVAILSLAIPIVINNFIQTMYNLTDTYWLGKLGTDEMAAISLVSPVQNIVINFGQGFTLAGAILISQCVGAKDDEEAKTMTNQLFLSSVVFSVMLALLGILLTPFVVTWLGAEDKVLEYGKTYLTIVLMDMPFLFMINLFAAVNQAQGDTVRPMKLNLLGVIINLFLDPLFILKWGVAGAALATMLSKVPCAIIALVDLVKKNKQVYLELTLEKLKPRFDKIKRIVQLGLPTAIGGSTMQFGFLLMTKNVLVYGKTAMAAYGIGNKINGIITMPSTAFGSATATIVGQNVGAGQNERADLAYRRARMIAIIFLFVSGMILSRNFISTAMVDIFSDDAEVIPMAADFLSIMAFCCWTNGIYDTTKGYFNGNGKTMVTMVIDATRLWVFRFLTLFICSQILHMRERSVWFSVVASNALSSLVWWVLYRLNRRKLLKSDN